MTPAARAAALFRRAYGRAPAVIASAPGRVNLIGEHLDYNGGEVLPMALPLRTAVAIDRAAGDGSRAVSAERDETGAFVIGDARRAGAWYDYVAGSLQMLRAHTAMVPAVDIAVASDVPLSSGLSSSAALEVATLFAASALSDAAVAPVDLARFGKDAENDFIGVPCGIMDQFASALARAEHAVHIRAHDESYELVPFTQPVLIFDTAVSRRLRTSAFAERRAECVAALAAIQRVDPGLCHLAVATEEQVAHADLAPVLRDRALHVIGENARVRSAVAALRERRPVPGALLLESHESLRTRFDCSIEELDWFVAAATRWPGVDGARLTGAGWGGCALAIGDATALSAMVREVATAYETRFGRRPRWWIVAAADGAHVHRDW